MANRDSQTTTPEINPQKVDQGQTRERPAKSLQEHLAAIGDALTAARWGLINRDFSGDDIGERVYEMRAMVEAITREVGKLVDPVVFGEPGKVLETSYVIKVHDQLFGLLYLIDDGLVSMEMAGDTGMPPAGLDRQGVQRLLTLASDAFGDLRGAIDSATQKHTQAVQLAH